MSTETISGGRVSGATKFIISLLIVVLSALIFPTLQASPASASPSQISNYSLAAGSNTTLPVSAAPTQSSSPLVLGSPGGSTQSLVLGCPVWTWICDVGKAVADVDTAALCVAGPASAAVMWLRIRRLQKGHW